MNVFDGHAKEYDEWYEKNRFAYFSELEALKKVVPEKKKGLEIGVGTGRFAAPLKILNGIDPSREMLELARWRGVNACSGAGEDLPFPDKMFDFVAIIITLCFVDDPLKVLSESKRVLKDGGDLIIGIVDKDSFLGRAYQSKTSVFYQKAKFFSVPELTDMLARAGFSGFEYYQTLFSMPDQLHSVETPLEGFGKGGFVVIKSVKT